MFADARYLILISLAYALMAAPISAQARYGSGDAVSRASSDNSDFLREVKIQPDIVSDKYEFSGLAAYYNQVAVYTVDQDSIQLLDPAQEYSLTEEDWLVVTGRFSAIALREPIGRVEFREGEKKIVLSPTSSETTPVFVSDKSDLSELSPNLADIQYAYLWSPFALMASTAEQYFRALNQFFSNWILTLLLFSLSVKALLYPLNYATQIAQKRVNVIKAKIDPVIAQIKMTSDGEEAHNKIMRAHKDLGVTPFYTLKPLVITLLQIPVLVATFNALGEFSAIRGISFLWITDLAYPDSIVTLPSSIPLLGSEISLLPVFMGIATFLLAYFSNQRKVSAGAIIMSLGFFLLFYPFPAILVMYWTLVNVWHLLFLYIREVFLDSAENSSSS